MLWQALTATRDLGRLHQIAAVLIRYGFGDMVRRLGLAAALEKAGVALHWNDAHELAHLEASARVRRALEELGPTFVKFGQLLASRVDLLEPEWLAEFAKLQDSAPAAPWMEIQAQLSEDLGALPEEVFAFVDSQPLAAASIAQVHRARLADGSEVVLKVRRPGIRPIVEADLRWLMRLAELAENESDELRAFRPREVVRQLTRSLHREMDFAAECRNAERIARNFVGFADDSAAAADTPKVGVGGNRNGMQNKALQPSVGVAETPIIVIPRIWWQWTGERLCVQEFIDGIPGRQLAAIDAAGLDRKVLAHRGAMAVLKMIVEDGLFHADPHPGNVFYLPGNRLAFIDFGMVGRLGEARRNQLIDLLLGLVHQEPQRVADVLIDWTGNEVVDESGLLNEIETFVDQYHGAPLKQIRLGTMLAELMTILRTHRLTLPSDLTLLVKSFISLEGMGRELDPDFNLASEAVPLIERTMRARLAPRALLRRSWANVADLLGLLAGLPQDAARLLRAARHGRLQIHIDVVPLKHVGNQIDRALSRLTVGIVVAALIVGSSVVMTVPGGPSLFGLPFFGLAGFLGAVTGGIWLVRSIVKNNRLDRE